MIGTLVSRCRHSGVHLRVEGEHLRVRGADASLLAELREHRDEVRAFLAVLRYVEQATADVPGITPEQFELLLCDDDRHDIAAGLISVESLRCFARSFAAGIASGRICFHPVTGSLLAHGIRDPRAA